MLASEYSTSNKLLVVRLIHQYDQYSTLMSKFTCKKQGKTLSSYHQMNSAGDS